MPPITPSSENLQSPIEPPFILRKKSAFWVLVTLIICTAIIPLVQYGTLGISSGYVSMLGVSVWYGAIAAGFSVCLWWYIRKKGKQHALLIGGVFGLIVQQVIIAVATPLL